MSTADEIFALVLSRLDGVEQRGDGVMARCPVHDDRRPSLRVRIGSKGVLLHCYGGCSTAVVVDALGLRWRDLFLTDGSGAAPVPVTRPRSTASAPATSAPTRTARRLVDHYDYVGVDGVIVIQVLRFTPKSFAQRRPLDPAHDLPEVLGAHGLGVRTDDRGRAWLNTLTVFPTAPAGSCPDCGGAHRPAPLTGLPLFRLHDVIAHPDETVIVTEGEKDVNVLVEMGLVAVTSAGGAGKWSRSDWSPLADRDVVVLPDQDEPGEKHATGLEMHLRDVVGVRSLRVVRLGAAKDVSAFIEAGGSRSALLALVEGTR